MYKNNFNLLRLYGAFQVLLQHSLYYLSNDNSREDNYTFFIGNLMQQFHGVAIFFLLSGFLIFMSYDKHPNIVDYTINRVLRIYPALYVNIFVSLVILYIFGYLYFDFEFFSWFIVQITMFQFYNIEMFRGFGVGVINGSLWTISLELSFYILLPILVFIYNRNILLIIIIFISSFLLWIYDIYSNHSIIYNRLLHISIIPHLFIFMIGMIYYKYFNTLQRYIKDKFLIWILLYLLFLCISNDMNFHKFIIYFIIKWSLFSLVVFSFAFSWRELSYKLLKGNDYTYGIYIYHMLIINIFVTMGFVGDIKYLIYIILLSILFGILSWYLIEKPFLKLKKHSLFNELKNKKENSETVSTKF
jgi:peptidoglycan/LPS O-acetylase OafA/YrhL